MRNNTFYRVGVMVFVQFAVFVLMMMQMDFVEVPKNGFEYYMMTAMTLLVSFVAGIFIGVAIGKENV
jgi:hypothetical protein